MLMLLISKHFNLKFAGFASMVQKRLPRAAVSTTLIVLIVILNAFPQKNQVTWVSASLAGEITREDINLSHLHDTEVDISLGK